MAFGGALVNNAPPTGETFVNRLVLTGVTLAARAGVPDITAADTGRLTTDTTPPANESSIVNLGTFGPGEGNWIAGDQNRVRVVIHDLNALAQVAVTGATSRVYVSGRAVVAGGNLNVTIHNHGAQATAVGGLRIELDYDHSKIM
jgi:hypothetical protein